MCIRDRPSLHPSLASREGSRRADNKAEREPALNVLVYVMNGSAVTTQLAAMAGALRLYPRRPSTGGKELAFTLGKIVASRLMQIVMTATTTTSEPFT